MHTRKLRMLQLLPRDNYGNVERAPKPALQGQAQEILKCPQNRRKCQRLNGRVGHDALVI